jgi:uncharacterized phage protein (TIGR02218 family)
MAGAVELHAHLQSGATTVCNAWLVTRADGVRFGFTDHDRDLAFDGQTFKASSGLSAGTLQQTTGMSVDNSEALGALSAASVSEADLAAGRFDGAEVQSWLVNWADLDQRIVQFRGNFGEVTRKAGSFRVELRGLSERLNLAQGRAYHPGCSAVLGDAACGVDMNLPGNFAEAAIAGFDGLGRIILNGLAGYGDRWFERGTVRALSGAAAGLISAVKTDRLTLTGREIELWHGFGAAIAVGDVLRLQVGCDKRAETCRTKFANFLNFRGFPHIPGEDWLASYPVSSGLNDGGSLSQ